VHVSFQRRLLASDGDRSQAASALREHYASGRLMLHEFDERVERVMTARTHAQIAGAFSRLPEGRARRRAVAVTVVLTVGFLVLALSRWTFRRVLWPSLVFTLRITVAGVRRVHARA
jgi:hypothetical protein